MEKNKPAGALGYLALILSMVLGATMSPAFKTALTLGITPMGVSLWRLVFTIAILLVICRRKESLWQDIMTVLHEKKLRRTVLAMGVARGFEIISWGLALSVSGTFLVNILGNTTPIFTILLLYLFYREKTSFTALIGVGVSLVGMVLVGLCSGETGGAPLWCVFLLPANACAYAIFMLLGRDVTGRISVWPMMLLVFVVAGVMVLLYGFVTAASLAMPAKSIPYVLFIAVFCTLISHTLVSWCTGVLPPVSISVIQLLSPVIAAVMAFVLIGESADLSIFLGGAVVLLGLLIYVLGTEKKQARQLLKREEKTEKAE